MRRGWAAVLLGLALSACLSSASLSGGKEDEPPGHVEPADAASCGAADLQNDVGNCGACGKVCGNYANAYGLCKEANCAIGCNTGFGDCDGKLETGCEATLATDSNHCGTCGHSCGGARCVAGQCQPYTIAELPGNVTALAGDATHLYYAYDGGGGNFAIGRVPKDGSASHADVITGIAKRPYALTLTATEMFWVKRNEAAAAAPPDGEVHRAPKAGGVAGTPWIGSQRTTTLLTVSDANVFYPTYDATPKTSAIERAAAAGTVAVDNTTSIKGSIATLMVDASFVYYFALGDGSPAVGRGLYRCPTSGCATSSTLVPGLPANAYAYQLASSGGHIYFTLNNRAIARMKPTGEEYASLVALDDPYANITTYAVDAQRLYWIEYTFDGGGFSETYTAWTCPLANCSDGRQQIAIRGSVVGLHVDDKAAYIVTRVSTATGSVTQVLKVVK